MNEAVDLTFEVLERTLDDLGMLTFPRLAGNPRQVPISNVAGFEHWWSASGGPTGIAYDPKLKRETPVPMFLAHNAHVAPPDGSPPHAYTHPKTYVMSAGFGDFDRGNGLNLPPLQVWEEVQRASRWAVVHRVDHAWLYSGSECGFHLRLFFKPEVRDAEYLSKWERAVWHGLQNEVQAKSMNQQCAEPARLERIPNSKYVHLKDPTKKGQYVMEENYCVAVPWQWVHDGNLSAIRQLSRYPSIGLKFDSVRYTSGDALLGLEEFVRRKGWETHAHVADAVHPMPTLLPTGDYAQQMKLYAPDRLCLQLLPFEVHPRHITRLDLLFYLNHPAPEGLGLDSEQLAQMIHGIANEAGNGAGWDDYDREKTQGFIDNEVGRPQALGAHFPHSCRKLSQEGCCVGGACPRFRYEFPERWAAYLATHPEANLRSE